LIRIATEDDAIEILNIYAPYITDTSFTFEMDVPTITDFKKRIRNYLETYPWLVYEVNGEIAGYAYAARHRERVAYQWCTESSIYVHAKYRGIDIGRKLYSALTEILKLQGFRNVYAVINLPNDKSVSFHERCGFKWFATYENVGYKLGRWKNVGWWKLQVNEYKDDPTPPIKFPDLDRSLLNPILLKIFID
jgi:L-amino acid N-acyltransferase YncA